VSLTRGAPVESRAEESRLAEPAGEGDFVASAVLHTVDEPLMGMPADEIAARSELAVALRPSAFPADAPSLSRVAVEDQAPEWVLATLHRVDQVTRYENVQQLWEAAGGHHELRTMPHESAPSAQTEPPTPELPPQPQPRRVAAAAAPDESSRETGTAGPLDPVFGLVRASWRFTGWTVNVLTAPARRLVRVISEHTH
jgi:hypothetical protein